MNKSSDTSSADKRTEAETRRKYTGGFYKPDTIMRPVAAAPADYFSRLNRVKLDLVEKYGTGKNVLDLCCATGEHLFDLSAKIQDGYGLDFSPPLLQTAAARARERNLTRLRFLCGNACDLPFPDASFGLVYCLSSLYHIPRHDRALNEIGRVLEPGGVAVFDLGNLHSLNTLVCRAHAETASPCHVPVRQMKREIQAAGLEILEHHCFQILPLWGEKPAWLRPLLCSCWKGIMEKDVGGKMLDQRLCALPLLRSLAFRHLFACGKTNM